MYTYSLFESVDYQHYFTCTHILITRGCRVSNTKCTCTHTNYSR